ncbi:MAG: 4Fe-4S binding protein [Phycisphaerales bacterium]|nr:4Fe-4S binding protein [Phycisphaerales bacterium]
MDSPRQDTRLARRRRRYSTWRAVSLIAVYVLAAVHIAHWRISGKTLAPLELNEVMVTLELGIITAGFVFMALIVVSAAIFGRFFCSWACHILALQDLCAWMLRKLRIRAKPVRSRALLLVAPLAMLYMFVWPAFSTVIDGRPFPSLRLSDDAGGWGSFVTDDFWRNLPGLWGALLTFAVCGFVIIYILGTRSFCQYVCPYGAVFGLMDRVAPGRIKVNADRCTGCAVCTGVCESHVRIHEEIAIHGNVVDPGCLKDLDCVAACPEGALSFGWTRPSLLRSLRPARRRLRYDFRWWEDVLMACVFIGALFAFRGLYGRLPFLLSLTIAGILAYFAVLTIRLFPARDLRFNAFQLKRAGAWTRGGVVFGIVMLAVWLFAAHSGVVRYHEWAGAAALERAKAQAAAADNAAVGMADLQTALSHMNFVERWGIMVEPTHYARKGWASWAAGDGDGARRAWRHAIEASPSDHQSRLNLAAAMLEAGRPEPAVRLLQYVASAHPRSSKDAARYAWYRASAWDMLAAVAAARGDEQAALAASEAANRARAANGERSPSPH